MDYYYALLNSYSLLKKRKFKLSLKEQEEKPDEEAAKKKTIEQAAEIMGKAGPNAKGGLEFKKVKLYQGDTPNDIMASEFNDPESQAALIIKGGVKNEKMKQIGHTYWSMMFPGEEDAKDKSSQDKPPAPGGEGTPPAEGEGAEGEPQELPGGQPTYPGVDPLADTLKRYFMASVGGLRAMAEDAEEVRQQEVERLQNIAVRSGEWSELTDEQIQATLQGMNDFLRLGDTLANNRAETGEGKYSYQINKLIEKHEITIDDAGCVYFGKDPAVGVGTCRGDSLLSTSMQQALETIQKVIKDTQNNQGIGSSVNPIPKKTKEEEGSDSAHRGVAIEHADTFAPMMERCMSEKDTAEKAKCVKEFQKAVTDSMLAFDKWEAGMAECDKIEQGGISPTIDREDIKREARECRKALGKVKGANFDQIARSLGAGLLAQDSLIFTTDATDWDRITTNFIIDRMVSQLGMSEEDARAYVAEVAGIDLESGKLIGDPDNLKALLLVTMANRGFTSSIHGFIYNPKTGETSEGIIPTSTRGVGQGQGVDIKTGEKKKSNATGAKADVEDVYCAASYDPPMTRDKIRDNIRDNLLSDSQREHYSGKCGKPAEAGGGKTAEANARNNLNKAIDSMIRDGTDEGDKGCFIVGREPKTHAEISKSSTLGETSHTKQQTIFNKLCPEGKDVDPDTGEGKPWATSGKTGVALSKTEETRLEQVKKTMQECVDGSKNKGDSLKQACAVNQKIQVESKRIDDQLTPPPHGNYVSGTAGSGDALIKTWLNGKSDKDKQKGGDADLRAEGAKKCLQSPGTATAAQCKHLEKLRDEVKNAGYNKVIGEYVEGGIKGEVTGDGRAYLQFMYLTTAGSDTEVLNEKRGLQDNEQKCGLRNAEIEANLGTDTKFIKKGSTVSIMAKDQKGKFNQQRAKMNAEGNTYKVRTGNSEDLYNTIYAEDTPEETERMATPTKDHPEGMVKVGKKWVNARTHREAQELQDWLDDPATELAVAGETIPGTSKTYSKSSAEKVNSPKRSAKRKEIKSQREGTDDLFHAYLCGQQRLLEKLINQTTKNPNT